MPINKLRYLLSICILAFSFNGIRAQINLGSYLDIGENNVSEGIFIKNAYRGSYQYEKYMVEAGMQFDLISNNPNIFSGLDIIGSREFLIGNFPFDVKGFFMLNRFSDIMYETNWGVAVETRKPEHFLFELGTFFRTYAINSEARNEYDINKSDSKLKENFNLMYVISAYVKPYDHYWNVGLSCTNVDYYIFSQSTNPGFNLQMKYKPKSNLTLCFDAWYRQAGVLNISANYFGYFFRGGVKWEIGKSR